MSKVTPTTSWGPYDAEFNGMVQLVVVPEVRELLLEKGPSMLIEENALKTSQCWHHVTLAFKPSCEEAERLVRVYSNDRYTMTFHPKEVRANPGICAVFGEVKRHGNYEDCVLVSCPALPHHITIGAAEKVQPKESKELLTDYVTCTAWDRYPDLPQVFPLYLNVVDFEGTK